MADSKLRDLSTDFAVKVIRMCDAMWYNPENADCLH